MNYRHAFHAGGFADVVKHIVLVRILTHLQEKPAAFRIIDTHAGAGVYDLTGEEAQRTGEFLTGIARVMQARFSEAVLPLVKPYLDIVRAFNPPAELKAYPGSPLIARALLRPQDRLTACEVEPKARKRLIEALRRDSQARVVDLDGWTALKAYVPPKERRGLVLIDPPYEQPDEFDRLGERTIAAVRKWPTGVYMLWYPIKEGDGPQRLARMLARSGIPRIVRSELLIAAAGDAERLRGSGLILINPPWQLPEQMAVLAPALATVFGNAAEGSSRLDWLAREK